MNKNIKAHIDYLLILLIACFTGYLLVASYHFVKDDMCNVFNFYTMLKQNSLIETVRSLSTNEWLGYVPRSFFITWVIQTFIVKIFAINDLFDAEKIFAVFIAFIQLLTALTIISIGRKVGISLFSRVLIASFYLLSPATFVDTAISNNWFFILPFFFLCIFVWYINIHDNAIKTLGHALILCTLMTLIIFSGEQLILCPFAYLGWLIIKDFRYLKFRALIKRRFESFIVAFCFLIFYYYISCYSKSPQPFEINSPWSKSVFDLGSIINLETIPRLLHYNIKTLEIGLSFFNLNSHIYSFNKISFSYDFFVAFMAFAIFAIFAIFHVRDHKNKSQGNQIKITGMIGLMLFSSMLPLYFACLSGSRPGPEERYIAIPALMVFSIITIILIDYKKARVIYALLFTLFIGYCTLLTAHLSLDIFTLQEKIDKKIYSLITGHINKNTKFLVTANNDQTGAHRGLIRPYLSAAWTDFQADWGFTSRFKYQYNYDLVLINNIFIRKDVLIGVGYWGNEYKLGKKNTEIVFLNDGPSLADIIDPKIDFLTLDDLKMECQRKNTKFKKVCTN